MGHNRGSNGKAKVNVKDLTVRFMRGQCNKGRCTSLAEFQINSAEAIFRNRQGKLQRNNMNKMLRQQFFGEIDDTGKTTRFWHSNKDPGNIVLLKAKLVNMFAHTVPRRGQSSEFYTTERSDFEGTHLIQTTVHQKKKWVQSSRNAVSAHHCRP